MFEFKEQGLVTVTSQARDLTYLTTGDSYNYSNGEGYIHFTSTRTGGSTFEKVVMLNIFQKQGRISFAAA